MAVPGDVQVGRISRFVSKWLGTKGFSPRLTFGSEVAMVIPLWSGVENRFLDSWGTFGIGIFLSAQAAATVGAQIRNPVGSGMIAVLEKITVGSTSAVNISLSVSNTATTDLTTNAPASGRGDGRGTLVPMCLTSTSIATPANLGSVIGNFNVGAVPIDLIYDEDQELPLTQSSAIRIVTNTNNLAMFLALWWRERVLEDSEKQ